MLREVQILGITMEEAVLEGTEVTTEDIVGMDMEEDMDMDTAAVLEATVDLEVEEVMEVDIGDLVMAKEVSLLWKVIMKSPQNMFAELQNIPHLKLHWSWRSSTCEQSHLDDPHQ